MSSRRSLNIACSCYHSIAVHYCEVVVLTNCNFLTRDMRNSSKNNNNINKSSSSSNNNNICSVLSLRPHFMLILDIFTSSCCCCPISQVLLASGYFISLLYYVITPANRTILCSFAAVFNFGSPSCLVLWYGIVCTV